ncbi:uncharacterized protein K02A2.6-like [Musca domestica]|uniref:RNA-directed DNA polymerase n=1 Tax=Musca domestica TaxID=7370 RepID=A0ABM3VCZ6_MUSDO|nr:uncharacterized protein K02A2.6-like [Musca domestica]
MDASQFAAFMDMQKALFSQISKMTVGAPTSSAAQGSSNTSINTTLVPNFDHFDPAKEMYTNYIERFNNYIAMKGVSANKEYCTKLLLNSIGAKYFNMVTALAAPRAAADLQYDELLTILQNHLAPKKNVLVAQHKFLSKYQMQGQSVADFVAALRTDINSCEFVSPCKCGASIADVFLRAQFIRGLCDNTVREQLLQSSTAKIDEIVGKALALEAAKMDARELSQATGQQKRKVNYEQLGIAGLCLRCGKNNHFAKECRSNKNLKCNLCAKQGHVAKVCIASLLADGPNAGRRGKPSTREASTNQVRDDSYGIYKIVDVYRNDYANANAERYYANIFIEGRVVSFEVDSGSGYSFLPRSEFGKLKLSNQLTATNIVFRSYTQDKFVPDGKVRVNIKYKNVSFIDDLYVVPDGCSALIGRTWIRRLGINLNELDEHKSNNMVTNSIGESSDIQEYISEFSAVFQQKIGCIPSHKVSLQLREDATPTYTKERQIPYALTERVNKELEELEKAGIITKVANSDWGSPLVVIPKADGGVRLCVDYKVGVNQRLVNAHYPIRKIDAIFNSLRDSKHFCRLDLYKAYLHVQVDQKSSEIQTISTHKGTFRMNRLSFGIKTAPAEFNRIIDQILREVPKTESYFDDIVVHGETLSECKANLKLCLAQLQKYDLHLNMAKCKFFDNQMEFLGHVIRHNKVQKSPSKVQAILQMPQPESVEDVRRFLGMVTYYARFIPNSSTITTPLRNLLLKNAIFKWTSECQKSFDVLKREISSDRVLMPYNPDLPVQLACDASPTGIAGVLSHIIDGQERPIAFASRSLTPAEQNYSQLDREALAIVYAVQHFHEYIFGRIFKLITDNKPLSRIFHQNSKLPLMTSSRLQRYAAFLTGYNYEVSTKKGEENVNADCLSRAPIKSGIGTTNLIDLEVHSICGSTIHQIASIKLNFKSLRDATKNDAMLSKILFDLRNSNVVDSEYTIDAGILFKGKRVIVPTSLQEAVLEELHYTHIGITKMKQLARRYVFWSSIDKDIEQFVRSCSACALVKKNPPKAVLHPWEEPDGNWQRIHIDYAGPYQGYQFLVVVDAKSKWAEVGVCSSAPTSTSTIEMLNNIFARNGYPDVLVSDNATIFKSEEFQNFCTNSGIFQKYIAPGHPATNGLAERNVQTLKQRLAAMAEDPSPISKKVREILFKYRATPLRNGKSPSEMYLGRQIRIRLDALKPSKLTQSSTPQCPVRKLSEGDRVQVRYYTPNKPVWKFGIISKKLGNLHYLVKLDNGYVFKRHIDQLRFTNVKLPYSPDTEQTESVPDFSSGNGEQSHQPLIMAPYIPLSTHANDPEVPGTSTTPTAAGTEAPVGTPSASTQNADAESTPSRRTSARQRRQPQYLSDYVRH